MCLFQGRTPSMTQLAVLEEYSDEIIIIMIDNNNNSNGNFHSKQFKIQ